MYARKLKIKNFFGIFSVEKKEKKEKKKKWSLLFFLIKRFYNVLQKRFREKLKILKIAQKRFFFFFCPENQKKKKVCDFCDFA